MLTRVYCLYMRRNDMYTASVSTLLLFRVDLAAFDFVTFIRSPLLKWPPSEDG